MGPTNSFKNRRQHQVKSLLSTLRVLMVVGRLVYSYCSRGRDDLYASCVRKGAGRRAELMYATTGVTLINRMNNMNNGKL